jgi:hypothetical protein
VLCHTPGLRRVGEGREKKICYNNNLQKDLKKLTSAREDAENVALLTECTQYKCKT